MCGVRISPKGQAEIFGGVSWPHACDSMLAGEVPAPFAAMRCEMDDRFPGAQTVIVVDPDAPWDLIFHLIYSEILEPAVMLKADLPNNQNSPADR